MLRPDSTLSAPLPASSAGSSPLFDGRRHSLTPERAIRAWHEYRGRGSSAARESLIVHYAPLVRIVVGRFVPGGRRPTEYEDLVSAGLVGLVRAVDAFDPAREVKFETFASAVIRGAVQDLLRSEDWLPRSVRERLRAFDRALLDVEARCGRPAEDGELADALGLSEDEVRRLRILGAGVRFDRLDEPVRAGEAVLRGDLLTDLDAPCAHSLLERSDLFRIVEEGVSRLPDREREVVDLYYRHELTFAEIARRLEISDSRSYQLHNQAVSRLREHLVREKLASPAPKELAKRGRGAALAAG